MCTETHFYLSTSSQDLLPLSPQFRLGGAIFVFRAKISLKTAKNMPFSILFRPMGAIAPFAIAPPSYATACHPRLEFISIIIFASIIHFFFKIGEVLRYFEGEKVITSYVSK